MNKAIYIFGVFFMALVCIVAGGDYSDIIEKNRTEGIYRQEDALLDEENALEDVENDENEYVFEAVADFEPYNNELQKYVHAQTSIDKTHIKMKADKLGEEYVSGKAESTMAFRYGTFSFRINNVRGKGLFPAIWMLPSDGSAYPEIDIYEHIGNHTDKLYGVIHFSEDENDNFEYDYPKDNVPESYVLKFEWTADRAVWYLDGEEIYVIDENIPDMPMYMIFNLAVGGNWPGAPDENTKFPTEFDVEILQFEPQETYVK